VGASHLVVAVNSCVVVVVVVVEDLIWEDTIHASCTGTLGGKLSGQSNSYIQSLQTLVEE